MADEKKETKKEPKKKKNVKPYKSKKACPKCGAGARLAEHGNRLSCGKCGYMERKG